MCVCVCVFCFFGEQLPTEICAVFSLELVPPTCRSFTKEARLSIKRLARLKRITEMRFVTQGLSPLVGECTAQ